MDYGLNKFVFVVCGAREHIDTLHYTLRALKHYTHNEIIVLTDSSRNEIPIEWDNIIDIKTPEHFDHHQGSIYLKTAIHRFLPAGNTYCYLDTDVIALSTEVDTIFAQKNNIITFAPDHCRVRSFSPYAVNCGCIEKNKNDKQEIEHLLEFYNDKCILIKEPRLLQKQKTLLRKFQILRQNRLKYGLISARFLLSPVVFKLDDDTFYHRWKRYWYDAEGNPILYDGASSLSVRSQIEKNSKWRWNRISRRWIGPDGEDVYLLECNHLKENIGGKFNIDVKEDNWQHWNGGVFLFDDSSHKFLDAWHDKTMEIFKDPMWRTRDQGTLITTAWEFGMQNAPLLSKKYNFIADYFNPALMIADDKVHITDNAFTNNYKPAFIHIYHHFGTTGWEVWDWVESKLAAEIPGWQKLNVKP